MKGSILENVGANEIGIIFPVSICMFLVALLVRVINPSHFLVAYSPMQISTTILSSEKSSDSTLQKFEGALMNALLFVVLTAGCTFLVAFLYYYRFIRFLNGHVCTVAVLAFALMGGLIFINIIHTWLIPVDIISFSLFLLNFTVLGVVSTFAPGVPIVFKQTYLVILSIIMSYWFSSFPEWSVWVLLVALVVYDLGAVLIPGGPLNLLMSLVETSGDELPGFIYESRPEVHENEPHFLGSNSNATLADEGDQAFRRQVTSETLILQSVEHQPENSLRTTSPTYSLGQDFSTSPHDRFDHEAETEASTEAIPFLGKNLTRETLSDIPMEEITPAGETSNPSDVGHAIGRSHGPRDEVEMVERRAEASEGRGESSISEGIMLGLGDFVFYGAVIGRAAMYDLLTAWACYLAIICGLACTIRLSAVCKRALPALPISISLGIVFYVLARLLMEPFVVGLSTKFMMF